VGLFLSLPSAFSGVVRWNGLKKYNIGDRVTVKGSELPGQIIEIRITQEIRYVVRMWLDGMAAEYEALDFELESTGERIER